jgi:hypothetical protein
MARNNVTNPIFAGSQIAAYSASAVADTDWHSLSSDDFYNTVTGAQLASGLKFAFVGVVTSSTSTESFIKLRAAAGAGDGTANTDGVIPVLGTYQADVQAIVEAATVTSIAYKKGGTSDKFVIYAGFNQ